MLENYKQILEKSEKRVLDLAEDILTSYGMAMEAFESGDIEKASQARTMLKDAHARNNKIDNEIIKTLALFSPEARDLRIVIAHLKIASELTRISDYVRTYAKNVKMGISGDFEIESLKEDTKSFNQSTYNSLKAAVESVKTQSEEALENIYRKVNVEVSKCDDIYSILEQNIVQQICITPESARDFIYFHKSMRKVERISDRSLNIVKLAYFAQKGGKLKL